MKDGTIVVSYVNERRGEESCVILFMKEDNSYHVNERTRVVCSEVNERPIVVLTYERPNNTVSVCYVNAELIFVLYHVNEGTAVHYSMNELTIVMCYQVNDNYCFHVNYGIIFFILCE